MLNHSSDDLCWHVHKAVIIWANADLADVAICAAPRGTGHAAEVLIVRAARRFQRLVVITVSPDRRFICPTTAIIPRNWKD
jgi:hypothetical protein